MSAIDTQPERPDGDSSTLQSQRVWKSAGKQDLDFDSQRLRNRLRAKMFGVDASPINIGRFTVLETVGSGGMGVVYAAYDAELDRRVAVKLLRSTHEEDASVGKGRLLREAQALAKLSHPNVVQVYDVGTFDDRVFVAMEFLPGSTMQQWLVEQPRPWPQVLQHFVDAGQGLAAAHRESIIHRDFKPANLLFGSDHRVRVVDFGLARASGHVALRTEVSPSSPSASSSGRAFATELTQTGEILGTPAYMSPEQARHEHVDARSDQYSFCVALYEALFGRRPHVGRSTTEVLVAVAEGLVRPPPRGTKVPARVVRAIMRGLAVDPAARFPSMDALLAELTLDRRARWRWLGGGALAVASLGVFLYASGEAPCPSPAEALADAWGPEQRAAIEASFVASGARGAESTAARVTDRLDDYADQWVEVRQEVCEAHHVRRDQSAQLHDLRMACLLERRAELGALARAFAEPDPSTIEHAPGAVVELSPIAACQDLARVQARGGADPAEQALRMQLAAAKAQYKAGRYDDALHAVEAIAIQAERGSAIAVQAEAQYHRAVIEERRRVPGAALAALRLAVDLAEVSAQDELAARAWMMSARQQAEQGELAIADGSLRLADAKLRRLGEVDELGPALLQSRAEVAWHAGRLDEAIAQESAALEQLRERLRDDDPRLGEALSHLANYLGEAGQHEQAQARSAEAREIFERAYGPEHPRVAHLLVNAAIDLMEAGRPDGARATFLEAERLLVASLGPDAPALLEVDKALAELAVMGGDFDEGERRARRLIERSAIEGVAPGHRLDGLALLSRIARERGDREGAVALAREFLTHLESTPAHADYEDHALFAHVGLAQDLVQLGRFDEARRQAELVLPRLEGNERARRAGLAPLAWQVVGDAERGAGDRAASVRAYARGLEHWGDAEPTDESLRAIQARLRWALATALPRGEAERAAQLARQARQALIETEPNAVEILEIDAWPGRSSSIEGA